MDLSCPLWGAAITESVKSWKNGQKYWNFLGKTDKDMIKRKIDRYLADHRSFVKSLCEYLGLFLVSVE